MGVPMAGKTLYDAILFNSAKAATEMPFFFQEIFEFADRMDTGGADPANNPQPIFGGRTYNQALEINPKAGIGFDQPLKDYNVQAIVALTDSPARTTDLISFIGTAFSESTLIKFATGFEAQTRARTVPTLAPSLPVDRFERNTAAPDRRARERDFSERDEGQEMHHL
jgi:hypothetical protein